MSEQEFNQIFAKNLKRYMDEYELTQVELAKRLNVTTATLYNWLNAIKTPRMSKVDAMCEIFHCKRTDLIVSDQENGQTEYYIDRETAEIAQELKDNPDLKALMDSSKKLSPEHLKQAIRIIETFK